MLDKLYVIAFVYFEEKVLIKSLQRDAVGEIMSVNIISNQVEMDWQQSSDGLEVSTGEDNAKINGYALSIGF